MGASRGAVPSFLRYGMYSSTAGTGSLSASSGSQMRAASRQPSASGIQMCSITRTRCGKSVTVRVIASAPNAVGD